MGRDDRAAAGVGLPGMLPWNRDAAGGSGSDQGAPRFRGGLALAATRAASAASHPHTTAPGRAAGVEQGLETLPPMSDQLCSVEVMIGESELGAMDYAGTRVVGPHDYFV